MSFSCFHEALQLLSHPYLDLNKLLKGLAVLMEMYFRSVGLEFEFCTVLVI